LIASLLILSIGFGTAWRKYKVAGAVPMMVFLVYNLATAVARTSGGRYIQPVQWIVYLYFGIGLFRSSYGGRRFWAEPAICGQKPCKKAS